MGNWFDQLRIQSKLFTILSLIIMIGALLMMWNVYNVIRIDAETNNILEKERELDDIEEVHVQFLEQEIAEKDYLLSGDTRYLDRHEAQVALAETHLRDAILEATTSAEKSTLFSIQRQGDGYQEDFAAVASAYQDGNKEKALRISQEQSGERISLIHRMIEGLVSDGEADIAAQGQRADRQSYSSIGVGIAGMVVFVLLAALIVYVAIHQIGKPILQLHHAVTAIGLGQFDTSMLDGLTARSDEIGRLARGVAEMGRQSTLRREAMQEKIAALRAKLPEAKVVS
jgi:CHASE3 domain sensor protein